MKGVIDAIRIVIQVPQTKQIHIPLITHMQIKKEKYSSTRYVSAAGRQRSGADKLCQVGRGKYPGQGSVIESHHTVCVVW